MLQRSRQSGVARLVVPAIDLPSCARIVKLAARNSGLFAAVGIHPTEASGVADSTLLSLHDLASDHSVVAIGEIGLDYYWVADPQARAHQRIVLQRQLELAARTALPVILHMREAADADDGPCARDLLAILGPWVQALRHAGHALADRPGVLHSFAGTAETAQQAISLGFFIGVTGPVTYKNAVTRRRLISQLALDRLLLETDSPFLAPVPHRGRRNEPAYVTHIADKIAEIQSRAVAEVAEVTEANAARLFAWGESG